MVMKRIIFLLNILTALIALPAAEPVLTKEEEKTITAQARVLLVVFRNQRIVCAIINYAISTLFEQLPTENTPSPSCFNSEGPFGERVMSYSPKEGSPLCIVSTDIRQQRIPTSRGAFPLFNGKGNLVLNGTIWGPQTLQPAQEAEIERIVNQAKKQQITPILSPEGCSPLCCRIS